MQRQKQTKGFRARRYVKKEISRKGKQMKKKREKITFFGVDQCFLFC
jgi:hypothetical protein